MIKKMSQLSVRDKPAAKKTLSEKLADKKEESKNRVDELLAEDWSDDEPEDQAQQSEDLLSQVIDNIWEKYDADGNGSLDMDEARIFVQDILKDLGDEDGNIFDESVYRAMFKTFDEDDSGSLEKPELY